jgi:hypothetical protein
MVREFSGFEHGDAVRADLLDDAVAAQRPLQILRKDHCAVPSSKLPNLLTGFRINDNPTSMHHNDLPNYAREKAQRMARSAGTSFKRERQCGDNARHLHPKG